MKFLRTLKSLYKTKTPSKRSDRLKEFTEPVDRRQMLKTLSVLPAVNLVKDKEPINLRPGILPAEDLDQSMERISTAYSSCTSACYGTGASFNTIGDEMDDYYHGLRRVTGIDKIRDARAKALQNVVSGEGVDLKKDE
jgi:hypothetical protein